MTQQDALNLLMMGKNVYLTGQAGSGKTYILNLYINYLKKHKVPVAITASTGIAATHLNGGTIHSWSGIGIKSHLTHNDIAKILGNENKRAKLLTAKVLIIDEISMFHSYRLDMVNQICKLARQDNRPFGGLQVILCGDFFQLPPINEQGLEKSGFAYKSEAWEELDLTVCYLDEQHRQLDDSFLKVLNDIRSQDVSEYTFEKLSTRLNKEFLEHIIPTKLYTHNADVDGINNFELEKIDKPVHQYHMTTQGNKELVDVLKKGCLAPEELLIKEGALVMFIKNNPAKGYINGTLGKVQGFDTDGNPIVQTYDGKEIIAMPTSWKFEENETVLAEISQVPLRLAWAITVHKSQGMSLDAAEIDLSKSFAYGMGYVALSRVKSLEGIRLLGINATAFMVDNDVAKFDEVLKKLSHEATATLQQLGENKIREIQEDYLQSIIPKDIEKKNHESGIKELFNKFFG
ncbi:MAG TPA: PIF1 family DEAD/DEAH box helicase [Candidatus Acidoferrales bacterium]|nr:PIF1 family DEAD/DEAH box helicase [Candidatus Acidoferrales bacterium]